jgi:aspartate/methionine/tyrosine aminotransferase
MKTIILDSLKPSATLSLNDKITQLQNEGTDVIHFGFGGSPFPIPEFIILSLKENAHKNEYLPVKGLPELREEIANYYSIRDKTKITFDNVIIGPGSKELLFLIQMSFADSIVYIPTPTWVSYSSHSKISNHKVKYIKTTLENDWKLTASDLKELIMDTDNNKILILNSPSNPTGSIYNKKDLELIADILKNENITIILDEIYEHQTYNNNFISLASLLPDKCIITSGLSKSISAGGWRIGWCVIPDKLNPILNKVSILASETYSTVNTPTQYATCNLFNPIFNNEKNTYLQNCNNIMKSLTTYCTRYLQSYNVKCIYPEASWYIFIDLSFFNDSLQKREIYTSKELCNELLNDINIAILPGECFGIPANNYTARLCLVDFNGCQALENIPDNNIITDEWLQLYCKKCIYGIHKLCEWFPKL